MNRDEFTSQSQGLQIRQQALDFPLHYGAAHRHA